MHNNLIPYLHKAWGEGGMEWYYNYTVKETYKLQVVKDRDEGHYKYHYPYTYIIIV